MAIRLIKKESPYSHWEFSINSENTLVRVVPERGGLITEWRCNGREILYFDIERFKKKNQSVRGGIPVLFPICGDLPHGILHLPQGDFRLKQHGFARDLPWEICLLENENGFSLKLADNEKTLEVYPYFFLIKMDVKLDINSLDISIEINNLSNQEMPFSFGLHPYFKVSDLGKLKIEGLPSHCFSYLKESEALTINQLANIDKGVDFITTPKGIVNLVDLVSGKTISWDPQAPMDLSVLWTDPPRDMVCIEPWTSPRNALLTGERQLMIDPGSSLNLSCRFECN